MCLPALAAALDVRVGGYPRYNPSLYNRRLHARDPGPLLPVGEAPQSRALRAVVSGVSVAGTARWETDPSVHAHPPPYTRTARVDSLTSTGRNDRRHLDTRRPGSTGWPQRVPRRGRVPTVGGAHPHNHPVIGN